MYSAAYQLFIIIGTALEEEGLVKIRWTLRSRDPNTPIATLFPASFFLLISSPKLTLSE
jgi:hypothetical protein